MKKRFAIFLSLLIAVLSAIVPAAGLAESAALIESGAQALVDSETRMSGIDEFLAGLESIGGLTYQVGSRGTGVQEFQRLLITSGYLAEGDDDGMYGKGTADAVAEFQRASGLKADGNADAATQFMLVISNAQLVEEGDSYIAQVNNYALILRPGFGFYLGSLNADGDFDRGTYYYADTQDYYAGEFKNNVRSGSGTAHFANGDIYIGSWSSDAMEGEGTYYFGGIDSGEYYEGSWSANAMNGNGTYTLPDGTQITGKWFYNQHASW